MANKKEVLGHYGEKEAKKFLEKQGFDIYPFGSKIKSTVVKDDPSIFSSLELEERIQEDCHKEIFFSKLYGESFAYANMAIHFYILNLWQKHVTENPLPFSGNEIVDLISKGEIEKAGEMKEDNRREMKKFPPGHPGRYDFIGINYKTPWAVEVKVNSSKLSHWQKLRFSLLDKLGHKTKLVVVSLDKEKSNELIKGRVKDPGISGIEEYDNLFFKDFPIPTDEEISEVLRYQKFI